MNKIILAFEVHSLVTETDVMNCNEKVPRQGGAQGPVGTQTILGMRTQKSEEATRRQ